MIFVDRREGSIDLVPYFKTKPIVTELEFGDVSFSGSYVGESLSIGVERKRVSDLIGSIASGRLSGHQIPGMIRTYYRSYLVVEGIWKGDKGTDELLVSRDGGRTFRSLFYGNKRWTGSSIYAYLTGIETFLGIPFRLTRDARSTVQLIEYLHGWWQSIHRHTSHLSLHNKTKRLTNEAPSGPCSIVPMSLREVTELKGVDKDVRYLVSTLPHIDNKRSIVIARHFKRPKDVFDATLEDWLTVPGIGKITAMDIVKFLHE